MLEYRLVEFLFLSIGGQRTCGPKKVTTQVISNLEKNRERLALWFVRLVGKVKIESRCSNNKIPSLSSQVVESSNIYQKFEDSQVDQDVKNCVFMPGSSALDLLGCMLCCMSMIH